jgi:tetratricopeptide (TPR) repeat protein
LGWLYHHHNDPALDLGNQEIAISYLRKSLDADDSDGQTHYLLGRCYMAQQKYRKAYDAYQKAVYRDGRNPTFWCSIGVLYYQINQYRDALDAYSRALRLNPYLSEVWYDLGTLYESCNQLSDSLDAYQRAAELDPNNKHIQQRLNMLRQTLDREAKGEKPKNMPTMGNAASPLPSTPLLPSSTPLLMNPQFPAHLTSSPLPSHPHLGSSSPQNGNSLNFPSVPLDRNAERNGNGSHINLGRVSMHPGEISNGNNPMERGPPFERGMDRMLELPNHERERGLYHMSERPFDRNERSVEPNIRNRAPDSPNSIKGENKPSASVSSIVSGTDDEEQSTPRSLRRSSNKLDVNNLPSLGKSDSMKSRWFESETAPKNRPPAGESHENKLAPFNNIPTNKTTEKPLRRISEMEPSLEGLGIEAERERLRLQEAYRETKETEEIEPRVKEEPEPRIKEELKRNRDEEAEEEQNTKRSRSNTEE